MTEQEYIRKAVELADGWSYKNDTHGIGIFVETCEGYKGVLPGSVELLDALAAQLVRQVDRALAFLDWGQLSRPFYKDNGPDRTMNTIRAIIDSGVLER